jgi:hypothetical protein
MTYVSPTEKKKKSGFVSPSQAKTKTVLNQTPELSRFDTSFNQAVSTQPVGVGGERITRQPYAVPLGQAVARQYLSSAQFLIESDPGNILKKLSAGDPFSSIGIGTAPSGEDNFDRFFRALSGLEPGESFSLQKEGEAFGLPEGSPFAVPIAGLAQILDFTGAGKAKGLLGLTKALKETDNVIDASKVMKTAGFTDDLIRDWAPVFAKTTDSKEIEKTLLGLEKLQNTTAPLTLRSVSPNLIPGESRSIVRNLREAIRPTTEITTTDQALLRSSMRNQQRIARDVAQTVKTATREQIFDRLRVKTAEIEDVRKQVFDFAKDTLAPAERGKALALVRDAKTQRDLGKAFSKISSWADLAERKGLRNEILALNKKVSDSGVIATDYKDMISNLINKFELTGHRPSTLAEIKKTKDFFQGELAKGKDVEIPRRVIEAMAILDRVPFEKMTRSQLLGLKNELELLEEMGRTKFRTIQNLDEAAKTKVLDEIAEQGAPRLETNPLIRPAIGESLTATQKLQNTIRRAQDKGSRLNKVIMPMDALIDLMDGSKGTYNGAIYRNFKAPVDYKTGNYLIRKDTIQQPVIDLVKKYKLNDRNMERIGVVAAREQDGGVEKLLASGFKQAEIDAIKLNPAEQEVLDTMRKVFDSQFPEIKDVMRRVYNQKVEKVKNYFSFMTDWKAMSESEIWERGGSTIPEQFGTPRKNVEKGFAMKRTGGAQKIRINAMDVFMQHTDNTSYLIEMGETTKRLGEIAASKEFGELVGDAGQLLMREWVDVLARKGGSAGASQVPLFDTLRKNVGAGILGLKLSTIAIQPTAWIDGVGFIGLKYGMQGLTDFLTNPSLRKFVLNMPEIKDRMGGEFAIRELAGSSKLEKIQQKGFGPMKFVDQMVAGAIGLGAYERKLKELGEVLDLTKYNEEALRYAQLAVRRTQSSGAFKDIPLAISRGAMTGNRSVDRAILQFQNFLLTRWSRIEHDAIRAGIFEKDPKKAAAIFSTIIVAGLTASGIRTGLNRLTDLITGQEPDEEVADEVAKGLIYELTGNVPFLGTAASMAMYDGEMFPILDAPKGAIDGLSRAIFSKSEGAKLRGMNEFAKSAGALLGIPGSAQAGQIMRGFLQDKKPISSSKKPSPPKGLPKLPSLKKRLPPPPGLPKLP